MQAFHSRLIALISLIGAGLSGFLSSHYYNLRSGEVAFHSICNVSEKANCDVVTLSSFAEFFPGVPLSSLVCGWLLSLGIFSLLKWKRTVLYIAAVGLAFSIFNFAIMALVLKTFCIFCLGIELICGASFLLAFLDWKQAGRPAVEAGQLKSAGLTILGLCFLSIVLLKGTEATGISESDSAAMISSILAGPKNEMGDLVGLPTLGDPKAPITLVEFSDFQCPYCSRGAAMAELLLKNYPQKLKVVFRNYPLDPACNPKMKRSMHEVACEAARVAHCAEKQGHFKDVYLQFFEHQPELKPGHLYDLLKTTSVDVTALKTCADSEAARTAIEKDLHEGDRLEVQSTPTFFINGLKVEGVLPPQMWKKLIESL